MGDEAKKLYVPPTAEQARDEEMASDDEHGYQLPAEAPSSTVPREGEEVKEAPKFRTAFIVFVDDEGMTSFSTDPNDILEVILDRPCTPNDMTMACTQLVRDLDMQAMAHLVTLQLMRTMQAQAQAMQQQAQAHQLADSAAQAEKARIDRARSTHRTR
jgi:hypothetical protein